MVTIKTSSRLEFGEAFYGALLSKIRLNSTAASTLLKAWYSVKTARCEPKNWLVAAFLPSDTKNKPTN
jgi:hypothetical protein